MPYIYETHMHTNQASACGRSPGRDYIQKYMDAGYTGIIITDHFYRGNCGVDRSLPWKEFIHRFCSGYEDARNEGEKRGFPVFFGWEENVDGDEYLIYGLDESWMMEHPDMPRWSRKQQYDMIHAAGGCVVQAHPFRARSYNHTIYLSPHLSDGVEVYNAGNEMNWNILAMRYAQIIGKPITAGSDNHWADVMRKENLCGVILDEPLHSIQDYVDVILKRKPIRLHLPAALPPWTKDITPDLPTLWLGKQGETTGIDAMEMLSSFTAGEA
ncbi:MAG: histidinol-phosphatase [Clostridia bacterium]|nr:histidinol-phosphatase [Clostridia bacterium]